MSFDITKFLSQTQSFDKDCTPAQNLIPIVDKDNNVTFVTSEELDQIKAAKENKEK